MRRLPYRYSLGAISLLFAMRAAIACSGNDDGGAGLFGEAGASNPDGDGSTSALEDGAVVDPGDGGVQADTAPPPPSYCTGVVLYATFDTSPAPERGAGITRAIGNVQSVAGRFGNALSFIPDASPDGAAVYFDREDGGPVIYPKAAGTIAFWYRQVLPPPRNAAIVRPLGVGVTAAGLVLARSNGAFGLWRDLGTDAVLAFTSGQVAPFLRGQAFDHFAEAWGTDDAGAVNFARLVLNGGLGEVFGDSGVDAAGYLAQAPDDAGNLLVPFRAEKAPSASTLAPNYPPLATLRLGGVLATAPLGEIDDFAVWDRVLSFEEIAELYKRNESIGAACKLP